MPCPRECQSQIDALQSQMDELRRQLTDRIVHGSVTPPDKAEGVGFTATSMSKGVYVVKFTQPFGKAPTVIAGISHPSGGADDIAKVDQVDANGFTVMINDIGKLDLEDKPSKVAIVPENSTRFSFIAIGPR